MAASLVFLLLAIASTSHAIYGGKDAALGEFPYIVSIKKELSPEWNEHSCAGIILNPKYVISSAHCLHNILSNKLTIIAGTVNLDDPKVTRKVVRKYLHDKYDSRDESHKYDLCIIEVDKPFELHDTVDAIMLPQPDVNYDGKKAVAIGWGYTSASGITHSLQKTEIPIVSSEKCSKSYEGQYDIDKLHICVIDESKEQGPCYGDDGGPLIVGNVVEGLFIWAFKGCASTKYPAIYARLSEHLVWINNTINK